jgi:hypothetical protein
MGGTLSFFFWRRAGMTEVMISFKQLDEAMWLVTANCSEARERFQQILGDAGL